MSTYKQRRINKYRIRNLDRPEHDEHTESHKELLGRELILKGQQRETTRRGYVMLAGNTSDPTLDEISSSSLSSAFRSRKSKSATVKGSRESTVVSRARDKSFETRALIPISRHLLFRYGERLGSVLTQNESLFSLNGGRSSRQVDSGYARSREAYLSDEYSSSPDDDISHYDDMSLDDYVIIPDQSDNDFRRQIRSEELRRCHDNRRRSQQTKSVMDENHSYRQRPHLHHRRLKQRHSKTVTDYNPKINRGRLKNKHSNALTDYDYHQRINTGRLKYKQSKTLADILLGKPSQVPSHKYISGYRDQHELNTMIRESLFYDNIYSKTGKALIPYSEYLVMGHEARAKHPQIKYSTKKYPLEPTEINEANHPENSYFVNTNRSKCIGNIFDTPNYTQSDDSSAEESECEVCCFVVMATDGPVAVSCSVVLTLLHI